MSQSVCVYVCMCIVYLVVYVCSYIYMRVFLHACVQYYSNITYGGCFKCPCIKHFALIWCFGVYLCNYKCAMSATYENMLLYMIWY